jgi:hypothetical protein
MGEVLRVETYNVICAFVKRESLSLSLSLSLSFSLSLSDTARRQLPTPLAKTALTQNRIG